MDQTKRCTHSEERNSQMYKKAMMKSKTSQRNKSAREGTIEDELEPLIVGKNGSLRSVTETSDSKKDTNH